ncbi:hypothetical protein Tco_0389553 [Tanacetum coccineum]
MNVPFCVERSAQVASTDVLAEAYKRAKEVVDAGGTNTSSNRKLLHPFRGRTLLFVQITPRNASDAYLQMIERRIEGQISSQNFPEENKKSADLANVGHAFAANSIPVVNVEAHVQTPELLEISHPERGETAIQTIQRPAPKLFSSFKSQTSTRESGHDIIVLTRAEFVMINGVVKELPLRETLLCLEILPAAKLEHSKMAAKSFWFANGRNMVRARGGAYCNVAHASEAQTKFVDFKHTAAKHGFKNLVDIKG